MICVKNLTKKYGDAVILDSFSYEFKSRGITCLLGSSGSGKSTLFNLIAGFDRDYQGEIISGDCDIAKLSLKELSGYRKTRIGFVFQEYNLIKGYTVMENILLAAELNDSTEKDNKIFALELIERLGIESKTHEKIENLSGGQKQRVAIARALINKPSVILADEPTGALDRNTANEIMKLFSEIAKEKPVIIITHDEKICDYANEVFIIIDGKSKIIKSYDTAEKASSVTKMTQKPSSPYIKKRAFKNF